MAGLVAELQADALNESIHVMALLRKAKAVSVKLNAPSISAWIDNELQGYRSNEDIPEYRHVRGSLVCFNYMNGHIPLQMDSRDLLEAITRRKIAQPLGQLCEHAANNNSIVIAFSARQAEALMNRMRFKMEPGLQIEASTLKNIIFGVRDKVMHFALELESQGIHGEGMGFSKEEKAAAASITYNTITIGNMHNSQVQQDTQNSHQKIEQNSFDTDLKKFLEDFIRDISKVKDEATAKALLADAETIKSQSTAPVPKRGIIKECLLSIKTTLEGAAGSVLASYIPVIAPLLTCL